MTLKQACIVTTKVLISCVIIIGGVIIVDKTQKWRHDRAKLVSFYENYKMYCTPGED